MAANRSNLGHRAIGAREWGPTVLSTRRAVFAEPLRYRGNRVSTERPGPAESGPAGVPVGVCSAHLPAIHPRASPPPSQAQHSVKRAELGPSLLNRRATASAYGHDGIAVAGVTAQGPPVSSRGRSRLKRHLANTEVQSHGLRGGELGGANGVARRSASLSDRTGAANRPPVMPGVCGNSLPNRRDGVPSGKSGNPD